MGRESGRLRVAGSSRSALRNRSSMNAVGVERQDLVIDDPALHPRADRQTRDPDPEPVLVDDRRGHVVVEAAPVVPG